MPNAGHMILSIGTDGETFSHESKACYRQGMTNRDRVDWLSQCLGYVTVKKFVGDGEMAL